MSNHMQLTPADFTFDMFFLADILAILSTKLSKGPGRDEAVTTFVGIARNYFKNISPCHVLPTFPYWLATFLLTNHLQDPTVCGRIDNGGAVSLTWSCALGAEDLTVEKWWLASFVRALPRVMQMLYDFKTLTRSRP